MVKVDRRSYDPITQTAKARTEDGRSVSVHMTWCNPPIMWCWNVTDNQWEYDWEWEEPCPSNGRRN